MTHPLFFRKLRVGAEDVPKNRAHLSQKIHFFWITVHFSAFGQNFLIISLEILQRICYFAANLTNTLKITNKQRMRTKYDSYNGWVNLFIVTIETLITGGLFDLLFLATENTPWHNTLMAPHLQVILTVMLCYFISGMQIGVVLYRRKVFAYQILGKVLRSTVFFGIMSGIILGVGKFMDTWSFF